MCMSFGFVVASSPAAVVTDVAVDAGAALDLLLWAKRHAGSLTGWSPAGGSYADCVSSCRVCDMRLLLPLFLVT